MATWKAEDVEILKSDYCTTAIGDLADKLGRTRAAIYLKANQLKLVKLARKPKSQPVMTTDAPVSEG